MPAAPKKQPARGPMAFALRMGVAAVIGLLAGAANVVFGDWPGPLGLILTLLVNAVSMLACLAICVWWWRGIDEAAREAHKWAWWWGGCTGLALGAILLLTILHRSETTDLGDLSLSEAFVSGMMIMMLCQVTGYGVAWLVWWAKRR